MLLPEWVAAWVGCCLCLSGTVAGRRLAQVLHSEPTSGHVYALFDAMGADPTHVTEHMLGQFVMRIINTCFGELVNQDTGMIDRMVAQTRLGGGSMPSPGSPRSEEFVAGFQPSLTYNQFVTYVVAEFRRALSEGVFHMTLASLYNMAC